MAGLVLQCKFFDRLSGKPKIKKGGKKKVTTATLFLGSLLYNDVFIQYKLADVKANCIVYATLRRFFFFFSICISSMSYAPAAEPKGLRGGNDGWAVVFSLSCVAHSRSDDDDDDDRFGGDRMRMNERTRKRKGNSVNNSPVG